MSRRAVVKVGIVDMNAGHENQAIRCFGVLIDRFAAAVREANPELDVVKVHVSPRDKVEPPPDDCDLYLSTGGPGSPFDGDGQAWVDEFSRFLDRVVDANHARTDAPGAFCICYSFEMAVRHFGVAEVAPRTARKFGVMPIYTTDEGRRHPLLSTFGDRLFAFEHRNWEAIGLDESRLARNGGKLLARESRDGVSKGAGLMAFDFAPGVEGVQFHPEADRPGVVAWVERPDQAEAFKLAYGITTYERMLKTLDDPSRLARTFAMLIPGWMQRRFNRIAEARGYDLLPPPMQDMTSFGSLVPHEPKSVKKMAAARAKA